jgi:trans-aconitate 2-methyltransferase
MAWNPQQYLTFEDHRLRPAVDLLGGIPLEVPKTVVDLGCGTGNVTRIIQERWPSAKVVGLDSSTEMLKNAREADSKIQWQQKAIADWQPKQKVDVIYSNASLHWLGGHETLFPRLMSYLKLGGYLAVQMPGNFSAPTHTLVYEAARSGPWKERLEPLIKPPPVMDPTDYYRILVPYSEQLDIWETTYIQALEGENPVAEWTKGTWLKPFLDALEEPEKAQFEAQYRRRILQAYPPGLNGKTLLPFRRIFVVARSP